MKIIQNKKFGDLEKGDKIQIKSFEEIKKTLDSEDSFDETRFTDLMINTICGKTFELASGYNGRRVSIINNGNRWALREPWINIL